MAGASNIGWTNATWNPVRGCERVSEGCRKCYAEILAARHSYPGGWGEDIAKFVKRPDGTKEARWTGVIQQVEKMLDAPLRWKTPRRIFVNSMSDLFHKDVSFEFVKKVWDVIATAQQHTFQILTKRPERLLEFHRWLAGADDLSITEWPRNAWIGVSVENQDEADTRIPLLQQVPASVHWLSCEPLLGPICIGEAASPVPGIKWVVVGGESGSEWRPMAMEDARQIIADGQRAGAAVFVKQDNGPRPGLQGRFTAEEWALKEYPKTEEIAA